MCKCCPFGPLRHLTILLTLPHPPSIRPDEILIIDSQNGEHYAFDCDGVQKGAHEALRDLKALRCAVTQKWVTNHWTLILWKLASLVRSRPDLLLEKWSYREVMRQLNYRYVQNPRVLGEQ
jgi:breast cancer 2 susceptibility protein